MQQDCVFYHIDGYKNTQPPSHVSSWIINKENRKICILRCVSACRVNGSGWRVCILVYICTTPCPPKKIYIIKTDATSLLSYILWVCYTQTTSLGWPALIKWHNWQLGPTWKYRNVDIEVSQKVTDYSIARGIIDAIIYFRKI